MTALADYGAKRYPVRVNAEDAWSESFTFSQSGSALNLSTWTWLAQIRRERDHGSELIATMTVGTGSAATGTISVSVTSAQTSVDPGTYWWVLKRTDPGNERTFILDTFIVDNKVAQA